MNFSQIPYNPTIISKAEAFAKNAHGDQLWPGSKKSYFEFHIQGVRQIVEEAIKNPSIKDPTLAIVCAILHDTIEDTDVTYEDILHEFGKKYADGVLALSKDAEAEKMDSVSAMKDSLQRVQKLENVIEIAIVKMADSTFNMSIAPPKSWSAEYNKGYNDEIRQVVLHTLGKYHADMAKKLDEVLTHHEQNFC